jgi:hypothetical protein
MASTMKDTSLNTMLRPGLRVRHRGDNRTGFVVGRAERLGSRIALVPVIVEGSTRQELWPETQLEPLPKAQQHLSCGGRYRAPQGYPLCLASR